jgi:hypothetical protein
MFPKWELIYSIFNMFHVIVYNVFGLGEVCEALACAVGQIAPNPCYTLGRLFSRNLISSTNKKNKK